MKRRNFVLAFGKSFALAAFVANAGCGNDTSTFTPEAASSGSASVASTQVTLAPARVVASSSRGTLLVSTQERTITKQGTSWKVVDPGVASHGLLNYPVSAVVDSQGQVYVLDKGESRIQVYSPSGNPSTVIGFYGTTSGALDSPSGIALDDHAGHLYVSDTNSNRIVVFSLSGSFVMAFGQFGTEPGQLNGPTGIALDVGGNLHVVDSGNSRINVYNPSGTFLRSYGSYGTELGQFLMPNSIAIDLQGKSMVSDLVSSYITLFDALDKPVSRFQPTLADGSPATPLHLAVGADGTLYVEAQTGFAVEPAAA